MAVKEMTELFQRCEANPIITSKDMPYITNMVFNPAAAPVNGETVLLLRVEDRAGVSHLTVARSRNGVTEWKIDSSPTFSPSPETNPEEIWGVEDPRITWVEELRKWVIVYTAYSVGGPLVSMAVSSDLQKFERLGPVMAPEDKDAALFPVRFDGRWALIHRPVSTMEVGAHIWLSFSPDLKHWGDHMILLHARQGPWWDSRKIGLSTPPLITEKGWLILYHGVRSTAAGCLYRLGLALLDKDNPRKVLLRSNEWVFSPQENYERMGDVSDVVFPCGWILNGDELRIYYGAADSTVCLATGSLVRILEWLEKHGKQEK